MTEDDACEGEQERFVRVESQAGTVLVRDDEGDLEEMRQMASDLLLDAESATKEVKDIPESGFR